jgi:hypothetical protein
MRERPERDGRIEAARLAIAICRDRLGKPERALDAVARLLEESPGDGDALDFLMSVTTSAPAWLEARHSLLAAGRDALLVQLHERPADAQVQRRLARVAYTLGDANLEQSALSCAQALGDRDIASEQRLSLLGGRKPHLPQAEMTLDRMGQLLVPGDDGPIAELFVVLGPTLAEALGPTLSSLGVHPKKDRIDPRSGTALRNEIATWAAAFGIRVFDLFVGGDDPLGVQAIGFDTPAFIVGASVRAPLSPFLRGRIAREAFAINRGTSLTRTRDDMTIAAIAAAACNIVNIPCAIPQATVLADTERALSKAMSRKIKAAIVPICSAFVTRKQDAAVWAGRARASQGRIAALASGDVAAVLGDALGLASHAMGSVVVRDDARAHDLLRFVLSRPYFDTRRALGLES